MKFNVEKFLNAPVLEHEYVIDSINEFLFENSNEEFTEDEIRFIKCLLCGILVRKNNFDIDDSGISGLVNLINQYLGYEGDWRAFKIKDCFGKTLGYRLMIVDDGVVTYYFDDAEYQSYME